MNTDATCPQCHAPLPADAPAGLCPRCLIRSAAGLADAPTVITGADMPDITDAADVARRLPQFEIIELLGKGGMGVVYKARQPALDRVVALKILPPGEALSPDFVERFRREARALAKLSHPNIVAVYECGESGGLYDFVMEYVDGANLRALLREHRLSPAEALAIVPRVCDALEYAHEEGVIHRDIKPENLLLDKKGRVKIADFGLAKLLRREALDMTLTLSGTQLGTLRYMAPEQMEKPESVDHRADIYSLGVVIYEMLTGEVPMGRFAPPSQKSGVDVRLDEIVLRSLEREPSARYQHASEVKTAVENVTQSVPAVPSPAAPMPSAKAVRTPADLLLLVAGIALLTAVGIGIWLWAQAALHPESGFAFQKSAEREIVRINGGQMIMTGPQKGVIIVVSTAIIAGYGILIGWAGLLLRRLRARLFVLLCAVLAGLFLPAALAFNFITEHVPQWPMFTALWLGMPVCVWAVLVLFRDDVREAFAVAAREKEGVQHAWTRLEFTAVATTALAFVFGGVNALFDLARNSSPMHGATTAAIIAAAACSAALMIAQRFRRPENARAALPGLHYTVLAACTGSLPWTWVFGDITGWNFWHGAGFAALNFLVALFLLIATGANIPRTRALVVLLTGLAGLALILWWNAVPVTLIGDRGGFMGDGSGPMTINRKPALAGVWVAAALAVLTAVTGALRLHAALAKPEKPAVSS